MRLTSKSLWRWAGPWIAAGGLAVAAAEEPPAPQGGDEKPRPVEMERPMLEPPADPLQAIAQEMKATGDRLERGLLDDETRQAQRKIVDDLERLLRQSRKKNPNKNPNDDPSDSNSSPSDPSPQSDAESSDGQPSGGGAPGTRRRRDQENAAESQERTEGGIPTDADRKNQRRTLTDAVWGHLPPRVQEQLNRSFSDRYLPEYDSLVKRYYEALATRRRDADPPAPRPARSEAPPP